MPRAPSHRSTWAPLVCAALVTSGGVALAAPDKPPAKWGAWNTGAGPQPTVPTPWSTDPLELETGGFALDAKAQELARAGAWTELVDLLARAADGQTPVRTPAQGPLLGPREAVRRRLLALPPAARRVFDELVEGRVKKLLATPAGPQPGREEALAELLERFGATPRAALAARLLGERLLERGDVAGAALLWRRALSEARDPLLERRLLALRTALPHTVEGSLGAPRLVSGSTSGGPKPWGVLWGRPAPGGKSDGLGLRALAVDGHHVYLTDHRGLVAVERDTGRLVWRTSLRGDPQSERLFVGHGRVLLLRSDRAVGVDAERGVVLWQRPLASGGDRYCLDAAATPIGFALLATVDGFRRVLGVAPDGRTLFETRLWGARPHDASGTRPIRRRLPGDPPPTDEDGQRLPEEFDDGAGGRLVPAYPVGLPGRPVADDGRLAALGDRIVVDADGILATLSTVHGGVVWIREAGGGLEVAGGRVLPAVGAGPFAVEAVTAAGHLVRLDPLDGSALELPAPPEGAWPEPPAPPEPGAEPAPQAEWTPPRPYVLGLSPLVLAWYPEGGRPWISVGCPPRRLLPLEPTTLAAVVGQVLALPDPEGVVLVDLASGQELGDPLPWCLKQGPIVAAGGLLFAVGEQGIVAYGPGGSVEDDPSGKDALHDAPLDSLTRLLGDDEWRIRQAARDELASRDDKAVGDLRRAAREAPTADARDAARGLLDRLDRQRVFRRLIPKDTTGTLIDLIEGRKLAERLQTVRDSVNPPEKGGADPDLERMFLEQDDPDVKHALAEILIVMDANLRRRLLATLCDPRAEKLLRVGCARALVEHADRGRSGDQLRRVAQDEDLDEGTWAILTSVVDSVAGGQQQLVSDLRPRRVFAQPPTIEEFSTPAARGAKLIEALPALLDDR